MWGAEWKEARGWILDQGSRWLQLLWCSVLEAW